MQNPNRNLRYLFYSFLLMPVIPLWYAIINFKVKQYHFFILAFVFLAGYNFNPGSGSDGEVYANLFKDFSNFSFLNFLDQISGIYSKNSELLDLYSTLLLFIVSRFTDDPAIFFAITGIIYYYFFLKLIYLVRSIVPVQTSKYYLPFLIGCVFIFDLFLGINGIRFALAFVIFSYGALLYLINNKANALIIAGTSILVHFSLFYSFLFLLLFVIFKNIGRSWLVYLIVLLGFVFAEFFAVGISQNINITGEAYEKRIEAYTNDEYIESRESGFQERNWYLVLDRYATYYYVFICFLLTKLSFVKFRFDWLANRLFVFSALMLIHNFFSSQLVDATSDRYYLMAIFFILVYLLYLYHLNNERRIFKIIIFTFLPILTLHVLVILRNDFLVVNPLLLIENAITAFIKD